MEVMALDLPGSFSDMSCRYHGFSVCRDAASSRNQGCCCESRHCCKEFENILLHLQDIEGSGPCVRFPLS